MLEKTIQQQVEKGTMLPLMEEFYTIQGEGYHTGRAAYFIRVGGCDVGCHWCDVKESWDPEKHPPTGVDQIVVNAAKYSKTIVVTGGEPLTWNMEPLTTGLKNASLDVHIETSGAYPLSGHWDWICLSPKKAKMPLPEVYEAAHELKVIVFNRHDLAFAKAESEKVSSTCKLFLQPEWSVREKMIPFITEFVMENPEWQVSLQTHKYLNIP
ncbi:organic radical activating enzyme [Nonlabens xylanidelens]|uniref:7-carboxy-7-deazaguanine synthase n=1 Tax=Nonlabens xylanidelens TaxID=191564 RepID=A0A2S6IHD8_9FLAO|nr:7-carboxy-7-deazaguanine synthase QueE [Nonlabens xylanidelens]PPK93619.1 organic radical activating enzyme [Nonlabens xylanidelens]PQJ17796.1 7-carboxy-7-deazaguanine synthase QueE [Nonlabens xylanidelens]